MQSEKADAKINQLKNQHTNINIGQKPFWASFYIHGWIDEDISR